MGDTTGWGRSISHNHNSGWNSRCSLTWLFTIQGVYPFIPRVRVQESEELPEVEEKKVRISWEKSVPYFLFSLINQYHPGGGERKHTCQIAGEATWGGRSQYTWSQGCYSCPWQDWRMWQTITWLKSTMTKVPQPRKTTSDPDNFGI